MTVADLLTMSRTAHTAYQQALRQRQSREARIQLARAAALRTQAEADNAPHDDPAWDEPGVFHGAHMKLLDFYKQQGVLP